MQYHSTDKPKQQTISHASDNYDSSINDDVYGIAKTVAIIGYITLLGWLVAIVLHDKHKSDFATFHLRQSLGLIITGALLALVPLIGWLLNVAVFLTWLYAIYHAVQGQKVKVPVLGDCYQEHLDFIK
ncbi:DUF4870 domain-containing protein [Candidatus Colwellia aromaticivorans]|uniref:DUF4870 domain-containing protein n=1 Tax=Candidatus Colwellia aromaticivorans TaxID=2267621 RepID=UPI001B34925A|nr:hypothetical protein [Candidatus Colwellia aromaticivorans]